TRLPRLETRLANRRGKKYRPAPTICRAVSTRGVFMTKTIKLIATCVLYTWVSACFSMQNGCAGQSGSGVTPVTELYTSEGCSSCPPADRWLSSLKNQGAG